MTNVCDDEQYCCNMCKFVLKSKCIQCNFCKTWVHRTCSQLTIKQFNLCKLNSYWQCDICAKVFPFHNMTDVELRRTNFNQTSDERLFNLYEKCDQFEFEPFGIADYNRSDFEMDVDPNNNFFNDVFTRCKYYTETQLVTNSKSIEGL